MEWLDNIAGPGYGAALLWTVLALVLLVIVLVVIKLVRGMTFGTFVAGGRNRKTRLAVMDATAIDSNRRLVLVRRDDIEHLILIGGATDIVVERDIRLVPSRRPALTNDAPAAPAPQRPAPVSQPRAEEIAPAPRPAPVPAPVARPIERPAAPMPAPAPRSAPEPVRAAPAYEPPRATAPAPAQSFRQPDPVPAAPVPARPVVVNPPYTPAIRTASVAPAPIIADDDLDDELLKELDFSLDDDTPPAPQQKAQDLSLDDEMSRLLGELSNKR